jgi:FKBP-type peptidyl-prolyl cis-trans isomerase FkpA
MQQMGEILRQALNHLSVKAILLGLVSVFLFTGCMKNQEDVNNPCNYDPCAIKAPASEIQQVQDYLTANGITAEQHCSGLFYRVDVEGTGATPGPCSLIKFNYEGRLTNGTIFESSQNPATLYLYQLITGWKNGLPKIKAGGRIYLYIPPTLGYGSTPMSTIPANSVLIFRVDLLEVH